MATSTKRVLLEARKIRKYLVERRTGKLKNLAGDCGYASLLLAYRLNDVSILRSHDSHAWTAVRDTVIDITATQFDKSLRGVYVGPPLSFHVDREIYRGQSAARDIVGWGSYSGMYLWEEIVNWHA